LRDDPRVSADTIVDNLDAGETPEDANFGLRTTQQDVLAI
jgi:uncharacterized protein (DUF433 family)